jgi:PAS domain-containing protein
VQSLHIWWESRRLGADVPDRSALQPEDMVPLLPCIFIADAEHNPFRVRYRLVGTRAAEVTGYDLTGRYLDELLSAEPDQPWMDHYSGLHPSCETRKLGTGCGQCHPGLLRSSPDGGKFASNSTGGR